jgi:hypothetical protein
LKQSSASYSNDAQILRQLYPTDEFTPPLYRAATSPATVSNSDWAAALASVSVSEFFGSLGPASAGSQLIRAGLQLSFKGGSVAVPTLSIAGTNMDGVDEGSPIPVRSLAYTGPTIGPKKIATITVFTRQMVESSDIEAIVRTTLTETTAAAIDRLLFGTAAASTAVPAGIRNGVAALTAATGGGTTAMMKDLGALVGAVAPIAGSQIVLIASPGEWAKLALMAGSEFRIPVLSSGALAAGTIMCVGTNVLAFAVSPVPEITSSFDALLHMDDAPAQIGTAGSPATVAAPSRSLFQTDSVSLRVIFNANWALRAAGGVAWVSGVTW